MGKMNSKVALITGGAVSADAQPAPPLSYQRLHDRSADERWDDHRLPEIDIDAEVREIQRTRRCSRQQAIKTLFSENKEAHKQHLLSHPKNQGPMQKMVIEEMFSDR